MNSMSLLTLSKELAMDEIENETLQDILEGITESVRPLLLPIDKLTKKASRYPELSSTIALLMQAEQQIQQALHTKKSGLLAARDIPFGEIFSLLKDCYSGKINDHLQSILENAEVELTVKKRDPGDPQSPKQLEIKIELAAAVIDKYAGLLAMVIGKKSKSKEEQAIINNASKTIDTSAKKLRRLNLMHGINQLEQEIYQCIEEHKNSHCFPFFCTGKTINQYNSLAAFMNNLFSDPLSAHELAGGLYVAHLKVKKLTDTTVQRRLTAAIHQVLKNNGYPVEEKETEKFIQLYQARIEQLNSVLYVS